MSSTQNLNGSSAIKGGFFNILVGWPVPNNLDRFNGGDASEFDFFKSGLDETDFLLKSILDGQNGVYYSRC